MGLSNDSKWITLQELAFGSISGSYASIGSALTEPLDILHVHNMTDAIMYFSVDGTNNCLTLAPLSSYVEDTKTNSQPNRQVLRTEVGTLFRVKHAGTGPTSGFVAVGGKYS